MRVFRLSAALAGAAALLAPSGAVAQPAPEPCETVLAEAERHYLEADYASVEPYVVECVYRPGVTAQQLQQAYRLLALSYIKQDQLAEAQVTIVKLFGVDYGYEADPVQDPPLYVALVSAVKDQLRVEADEAAAVAAAVRERPPAPEGSLPEVAAAPVPLEVRAVNVNTASAAELEALPGIGPALAERVVAYRTAVGPFARVEDLQGVRGIGARTVANLAPYATVGDGEQGGGRGAGRRGRGPEPPAPQPQHGLAGRTGHAPGHRPRHRAADHRRARAGGAVHHRRRRAPRPRDRARQALGLRQPGDGGVGR